MPEEEGTFVCTHCGGEFPAPPIRTNSGKKICNDCYTDAHGTCCDCQNIFLAGDLYTTAIGNYICACCVENYRTCNDCGELYHLDDIVEHNDRYYCADCALADTLLIHDYHYTPPLEFLSTRWDKKPQLFLGVELEVEFPEISDAEYCAENTDKKWWVTQDRSLTCGAEWISHPATLLYHENEMPWEKLLRMLKHNGGKSHDTSTCGLHVHVSANFFSKLELIKLALFVYAHKLKVEKVSRRSSSEFAEFVPKPKKYMAENETRYEVLNFTNKKTVEFRCFRGTLNLQTLLATLQFVDAVCRYVKTIGTGFAASDKSWSGFLDFLKKHGNKYGALQKYLAGKELCA